MGTVFFSKSDKVVQWWMNILPIEKTAATEFHISYHGMQKKVAADEYTLAEPDKVDKVMLVLNRLSRIYYLKKFFDYPIRIM